MFQHPDTIATCADLHRHDLLATAANERQAQSAARPAPEWHSLAVRAFALLSLLLGLRV
jgi:hypothetical protein